MEKCNISKRGTIQGRLFRDPTTGLFNVTWETGEREVYSSLEAIKHKHIRIKPNSKYAGPGQPAGE